MSGISGDGCETGRVERPDTSLNQQFNEQYAEVVETIQQRAIWRIGERVTDLGQFRCHCGNCGYDSAHQRFDLTRHRLLFGRSIRQIEGARPMVRCERCGTQRHVRDLDALVVPTTIRLHALVLAEVPAAGQRSSVLGDALTNAIATFRDEASPPLCRSLVADIADGATSDDAEFVAAVGRALFLTSDQIDVVVAQLG